MQSAPDVVILCGGKGERVKHMHPGIPKPLFPVNGKPFLDYLLEFFLSQGLQRIILSIGYLGDAIETYYKHHRYSSCITISDEGDRRLGTAGAVKLAQNQIRTNSILVSNGDSLCAVDCTRLLAAHREHRAAATVVIAASSTRIDAGNITINNKYLITSYKEKKGKAPYINAGIYVFEKNILSLIPEEKTYSIEYDVFPNLVDKRLLYGFGTDSLVYDIGTTERLGSLRTITHILPGGLAEIREV